VDLDTHLALDRYCDENPLYSLIDKIKYNNKRKLKIQSKNEGLTIDPKDMDEIIYDINKLGTKFFYKKN